ncbi:MAG: hypothetical protein A3B44_01565 [Candidatus Levybacteria bacterium RIFCSPLOWO2_01_FULL_38_21]|nr:MAG: hypothetical protein A3B44_01565 [Candidatus Levybacteria bacterium RIFCSPLOWO2_01_FULL_38_21]
MSLNQKGQVFVTLLFFVIIGVTIISAETIVLFTNILSGSTEEQGANAYYVAESGIEEALLRLNRNPGYAGGVLTVGQGNAATQVGNGIITATGTYAGTIKKIEVQIVNNDGALRIVSWKEI